MSNKIVIFKRLRILLSVIQMTYIHMHVFLNTLCARISTYLNSKVILYANHNNTIQAKIPSTVGYR
jgi:hypothetical protein